MKPSSIRGVEILFFVCSLRLKPLKYQDHAIVHRIRCRFVGKFDKFSARSVYHVEDSSQRSHRRKVFDLLDKTLLFCDLL